VGGVYDSLAASACFPDNFTCRGAAGLTSQKIPAASTQNPTISAAMKITERASRPSFLVSMTAMFSNSPRPSL
jgi:hypothetical protein